MDQVTGRKEARAGGTYLKIFILVRREDGAVYASAHVSEN